MYTDNACVSNVYHACNTSAAYYVSTPTYNFSKCIKEEYSVFQEILDNKVTAEQAQYPAPYAAPAIPSEETVTAEVSTYCPTPEVSTYCPAPAINTYCPPPTVCSAVTNTVESTSTNPISTAAAPEPTGAFNIGNYYPISEAEVVQEIRKIRHIINSADISGKSDIDKYNWIENRFIDAFGKDFMMARNLGLPSSMFYMVGLEFNDTLNRHMDNPEHVNRQRLYGDASAEEIQRRISAKYPDELTNRDLFLKVHEMRNSGVLDSASIRSLDAGGVQRMMDTLRLLQNYIRFADMRNGGTVGPISLEERDRRWAEMLNNRAKVTDVQFLHNLLKYRGVNIGDDTVSFLVNFTGGELNENGYFVLPPGGNKNFDEEVKVLLSNMDEYDALVRSRMALIDFEAYVPVAANGVINSPAAGAGAEVNISPGAENGSGAEEVSAEYGSGAEEGSAEYGSGAEEGAAEYGAGTEEYSGAA